MAPNTTAGRPLRLALVLAVLAAPTLRLAIDASVPDERDHVEASHDADRCRVLHDHEACLLLFASSPAAAAAAAPSHGPTSPGSLVTSPADAPRLPEGHAPGLPRAPPAPLV